MKRNELGFSLVELLVAVAVFAIVLTFIGAFFVQQSRVTALSQAINEAESVARSVAEVIIQDLQIAGSRAVMQASGRVNYVDSIHPSCRDTDRSGCVVARSVDPDGIVRELSVGSTPTGYTVWYRSSLDGDLSTRRVDIALIGEQLHRSDVPCRADSVAAGESSPPVCDRESDFQIDVDADATVVAVNVRAFGLEFLCEGAVAVSSDPLDCYVVGDESSYVRQGEVTVAVNSTRRGAAIGEMSLTSGMPNLRPGIDFLRGLNESEQ